jgi:diguanylate cyclase (GGDEF)-like protein
MWHLLGQHGTGWTLVSLFIAVERLLPSAYWSAFAVFAGSVSVRHYRQKAADAAVTRLAALAPSAEITAIDRLRLLRRDPLTDLPNLRKFDEVASQHLASQDKLIMVLLDLDRFQTINEVYGLHAGDRLLQEVADRLRVFMAGRDCVAHIFSDRFGILAVDTSASDAANTAAGEQKALSLLRAFKNPFVIAGVHVPISVSIGIARAPRDGDSVTSLLQAATRALHAAKASGGGKFHFHQTGAEEDDADLRRDLPLAIAVHQIKPYYQPIVDLASGEVAGLEVLARWDHPVHGLLPPEKFVAMAERIGQLSAMTADLLEQVTQDTVSWPENLTISFNISASQLREFAAYLIAQKKLIVSRLPASRIEVELTEDVFSKDLEATREVVRLLHKLGTRVTLDDFGAGSANLHHLRAIPFDRLKIDKDFVLDLLIDPRAEICVRGIAGLGHVLKMEVIAKGISLAEIATRVRDFGCQFGQGSLYAMPVPAAEVAALLVNIPRGPAAVHWRQGLHTSHESMMV